MSDISIKTLKDTKSVKNSFYTGVVEDIHDPEKMDRVKVRVMGIHIEERSTGENHLKTEELPWANVMAPTVFGMSTGIGTSFCPVKGTWVIVFFENDDLQKPMVIGTIKGIPTENQCSASQGFTDPDGEYPLKDRLKEPDTNRLHRNENYSKTELSKNRDPNLEKNIKYTTDGSSNSGSWNMPTQLNTNTTYPDNTVIETKSGHIIEIDDTPGNERIHVWHPAGSFLEFRPDGSVTTKATNHHFRVVNGNKHELVNGFRTATIDNDDENTVGGDKNTLVQNNYNIGVGGTYSLKAGNEASITAGNIYLN